MEVKNDNKQIQLKNLFIQSNLSAKAVAIKAKTKQKTIPAQVGCDEFRSFDKGILNT